MLMSSTTYWPFTLNFTVKGANNVKITGVRSCDPYVTITIDGKFIGQTQTSYSLLTTNSDPIWNENFTTPLLHSEISLKFSLFDRRLLGSDFLVGEAELYVEDYRKNVSVSFSLKIKKDNLSTGVLLNIDLNITTCDNSIKVTAMKKFEKDILVRTNSIYNLKRSLSTFGNRPSSSIPPSILFSKGMLTSSSSSSSNIIIDSSLLQAENYLSNFNMPSLVRSVLLSSPILTTLNSTPFLVNDLLSDLENLSLLPLTAISSTNTKKPTKSVLVRDPISFSKCTRIDLVSGACSAVMPIYSRDSFPLRLETLDTVLLLRMPNQYILWVWLSALKRSHNTWQNSSSTLSQLPPPSSPQKPSMNTENNGSTGNTGFNSHTCRAEIYSHGLIQRIYCVISANRPELRCYYNDSEKVSVIDLSTIISVTVSCDYNLRGSVDLNVEILTSVLPFEYWSKDIKLLLKLPNQEATSTATQNGINTLSWNKKMSFSLPQNTTYDSKENEIKFTLYATVGKDTLFSSFIPLSSLKTDDDLEGAVMEELVKLKLSPKLLITVVSANSILCLPCVQPEDGIEVNCAIACWNGVVKEKIKSIARGNRSSTGTAQRKANSGAITYIKPRLSDMRYETVSVQWNYDYTLSLTPDTAATAEYVRVDMIDKMSRTSLGRAFIPLSDFSDVEKEVTYEVVPYDDVSSSFIAQLGTVTIKLKYAPVVGEQAIEVKLKSILKKSDDYTTLWPIESVPTKSLSRIDIRSVVEKYCIRIDYDGIVLINTTPSPSNNSNNDNNNNNNNNSNNNNSKFKPIPISDTMSVVSESLSNAGFIDFAKLDENEEEFEELESLLLPTPPAKKRGHVRHSSEGATRKSGSGEVPKLNLNGNSNEGKSVIKTLGNRLYNPFTRKAPSPLTLNAQSASTTDDLNDSKAVPKPPPSPSPSVSLFNSSSVKDQKPLANGMTFPTNTNTAFFRSRRRTRQQVYAENEDYVLGTCKERGDYLDSDLRIPWPQVISVTAITPAILVITIRIQRYTGTGTGAGEKVDTETFEPATVELFVQGCPAMALRKILLDRQEVASHRDDIHKLVSKSLDPVLRNGKSFQRSLRSLIVTLYHACHSLVKRSNLLVGYKTGVLPAMLWLDTPAIEKKKLLTAITRLRLYMAMLLEKFEVMSFIKEDSDLFRKDQQQQKQQQHQNHAISSPRTQSNQTKERLLATKDKLDSLFQGAENHLVCAAVYAEVHDKATTEADISSVVNRYFSFIVSVLGKIYEDLKGLTKIENLECYFIIVYLFVGGNDRLHRVLGNTLISLSMTAEPPPMLSLVFDIKTILSNFSSTLSETLGALVELVVQNWRNDSKNRTCESRYKCQLPWDPVEKSAAESIPVLVSRIPEEIAAAIRVCLVLDGLENTFFAGSLRGMTCPEDVTQTLQDAVTSCYLQLYSRYLLALDDCCAEWSNNSSNLEVSKTKQDNQVKSVATTNIITPAERIEDNLFFLCSVANDAYRIETGVGVDILIDSRCEEFGLTAEEFRSLAVCASFNSLRCAALEYIISLLFQPLQKKYVVNFTAIWLDSCHKDTNGPMDKIMKSLCNNVLFLRERLELNCFRELIEATVSRVVKLFFTFLNDALVTDVIFSEIELRRIIVDIDMIKEFLSAVAATEDRYHPITKSTHKIEDDIQVILQPLNMFIHLLIAPIFSKEFDNSKLFFSRYDKKNGSLGDLVNVKLVELRADQGIFLNKES